jgi:hypothetical protein
MVVFNLCNLTFHRWDCINPSYVGSGYAQTYAASKRINKAWFALQPPRSQLLGNWVISDPHQLVPLGATGAAFCPCLSGFGKAISLKPLERKTRDLTGSHEVRGSTPPVHRQYQRDGRHCQRPSASTGIPKRNPSRNRQSSRNEFQHVRYNTSHPADHASRVLNSRSVDQDDVLLFGCGSKKSWAIDQLYSEYGKSLAARLAGEPRVKISSSESANIVMAAFRWVHEDHRRRF